METTCERVSPPLPKVNVMCSELKDVFYGVYVPVQVKGSFDLKHLSLMIIYTIASISVDGSSSEETTVKMILLIFFIVIFNLEM